MQQQQGQQLQCPRCESINTKFCYYNNYNLSQPRHFCKDCRRYWTKGGALRNVPVGGNTRKSSKRTTSSSSCSVSVSNCSHRVSSDNSSSVAADQALVGDDHELMLLNNNNGSEMMSFSSLLLGSIGDGEKYGDYELMMMPEEQQVVQQSYCFASLMDLQESSAGWWNF